MIKIWVGFLNYSEVMIIVFRRVMLEWLLLNLLSGFIKCGDFIIVYNSVGLFYLDNNIYVYVSLIV